ncbi:MBL fold metallo-hydrolase [Mameliella sediminis]|uniref:MBL fold metallo-hydrolase n=1 Tax=Mameliella sediminis TaxID=2836866 RepID=UPI001C44C870|nr:MBL fold metallo-hydrolase [Mameliella sediminis]MBV7393592.1 MBL fold metallo-hydrolase [Mameliella sediminis]
MTTETHKLSLGDIEMTVLNDGGFTLPSGYFFNLPEEVAAAQEATRSIGANLWFIKAGDRRILVDTGSAEALRQMFPQTGQAWDDLRAEDVTDIVLTHMHADHIGGLADRAAFPEARIHVARAEWEFWTQDGLADAVPEDQRPMILMIQQVAAGFADRVVLHDGSGELTAGVRFEPLPGHTPGHCGLRLGEGKDAVLIVSDAVISEDLQFANPEIGYALDSDAAQAAETRKAMLTACANSGVTIAATHFAFPGLGKVAQEGEAFRFLPV